MLTDQSDGSEDKKNWGYSSVLGLRFQRLQKDWSGAVWAELLEGLVAPVCGPSEASLAFREPAFEGSVRSVARRALAGDVGRGRLSSGVVIGKGASG